MCLITWVADLMGHLAQTVSTLNYAPPHTSQPLGIGHPESYCPGILIRCNIILCTEPEITIHVAAMWTLLLLYSALTLLTHFSPKL